MAAFGGRETPCPRRRARGGQDTLRVSYPPLNSSTSSLGTLSIASRLNARGPQGRLVLQGFTLDGSGAFRSDGVTALHRLAAHCYAWQTAQGKFRASRFYITTPTHGSVPPSPPFRRATAGSRVLRKVWGVKRGKKTLVVFPLLPPPPGGGNSHAMSWRIPPTREGHSRLRRQAAGTAEPFTPCSREGV